jgi:pre-rRNA-processing protein TSR2
MNSNDHYVEFQAGVTAALRSWSALRTAVEQSWGSINAAEDLRSNIYHHFHDGSMSNGKSAKIMTRDELEENLLDYMEDEFGVILEDGSEREVSDLICRMYENCGMGDISLARSVLRGAIMAEIATSKNDIRGVFQDVDGGVGGEGDMDDANDDENEDDDDIMDEGDDDSVGGTEDDDGLRETTSTIAGSSSSAHVVAMMGGDITTDIPPEVVRAYASGALFGNDNKPNGKKELPPPRQLGEPEPVKPLQVLDDDGFATVPTKRRGGTRANGAK